MKNPSPAVLLVLVFAWPIVAQDVRVEIGKPSQAIPKVCELVTPANIDGSIDVPALVKEAICKGAGSMMAEYTYTMTSVRREKDKKGKVKEETFVYEVFIPTLKSGTRTKGILVVTSHDGVPVTPEELEKAHLEAAKKIEKEEARIDRVKQPTTNPEPETTTGMRPLGMYTRTTHSRASFGFKSGATLSVADFLKSSDLTLARREQIAGRDTLVFNFVPRPGTEFIDNTKYMAQLSGEIWIDATDRIVTRLIGWPRTAVDPTAPPTGEVPPAVYVEMMRLPQAGIWLPRVVRINGADYQRLFDGIKTDSIANYSDYLRFSTDVKNAEIEAPKKP